MSNDIREMQEKVPSMTRRKFMKVFAGVGTLLLGRNFAPFLPVSTLSLDEYQRHPIQRLVRRLQAILSDTNYEEFSIFYRNLLMANKLLEIGRQYNQGVDKPAIAYDVGALHSGIEDFLFAGPDICRWLILNIHSKELLAYLVDYNGGPESFLSAKILQKNSDGIQEKIVIDSQLFQDLQALLNS